MRWSSCWYFRSRFVRTNRMGQSSDEHCVSCGRPQQDWHICSICRNFLSILCIRALNTKATFCGCCLHWSQITFFACRPHSTTHSVLAKYCEMVLRFFGLTIRLLLSALLLPIMITSLVSTTSSNFNKLLRRSSSNLEGENYFWSGQEEVLYILLKLE